MRSDAYDRVLDPGSAAVAFGAGQVELSARGRVGRLTLLPGAHAAGATACQDVVRAAVDAGFGLHGLASITWAGIAGDIDGWRAMWANGFSFTGVLRSSQNVDGGVCDGWRAVLLATDARDPKTTWFDPVRLDGDDVVIRDVAPADEARFLAAMNDPESHQWLGTIPMPRTAEAFRDSFVGRRLNPSLGKAVNWTIADPGTDEYLGSVTVFGMGELDYKSGEIGYRTHPDARGRGVATAAVRAVLRHAFTPLVDGGLGLERMQLLAGDGNDASQGVARSCGFTEGGRDRQCYDLADGRIVDLIRFDLLKSEFDPGS